MPAGTITLTNNSAVVNGSGTSFSTELAAGDMIVSIVGGVTYTLPVKSVDSATKVTLIKAYDGPTQSGAAWSAVPRETLNAITAQLAAETAKALRGLNYDKENWQQVFSGSGDITVRLPDGSTYIGPAWRGITDKLNEKADKNSLGTAAGYNVQTHIGDKVENRVLIAGGYGLGIPAHAPASGWEEVNTNFSWNYTTNPLESYGGAGHELKMCMYSNEKVNDFVSIFYVNRQSGNIGVVVRQLLTSGNPTNTESWRTEFRTTRNTSVDANGFIKHASPIARITNNSLEMDADFLDGFTLAGSAAVNDEATGVHAERVSTGVYRITGAQGLAKEGWTIEVPQDVNGNRLCFVATETDDNGTITVTVSKRRFDIDTAMIVAGELMDIPDGRWIDLRLEM